MKIAIANGNLLSESLKVIDVTWNNDSGRCYHGRDRMGNEIQCIRGEDIPRYVHEGNFDLGITRLDWYTEFTVKREMEVEHFSRQMRRMNNVIENQYVVDYPPLRAAVMGEWSPQPVPRWVLAVSKDSGITPTCFPENGRIVTRLPNLVIRHIDLHWPWLIQKVNVEHSAGTCESKVPRLAAATVCVTVSGKTLAGNNLVEACTILESTMVILAREKSTEVQSFVADILSRVT